MYIINFIILASQNYLSAQHSTMNLKICEVNLTNFA